MSEFISTGYSWPTALLSENNCMIMPAVKRALARHHTEHSRRLLDLGCGNGACAGELARCGWSVTGVDGSAEGVSRAMAAHPHLTFHERSLYEDLPGLLGQFDAVVSLEVVEHLYAPRAYAKNMAALLKPKGVAVISTPFHGYIKNLAIALTGKTDRHVNPLWDHGHIKFWSRETLTALLAEAGLEVIEFMRVGRIPPLAKSMVLVARHTR